MTRIATITTPLGEALRFRTLRGSEHVSGLFRLEVGLIGESPNLDLKALIGQPATLHIELEGGGQRQLNGLCTDAILSGRDGRHLHYQITLQPWLWLATRRSDHKIFQHQSVPDIVKAILGPYGYPVIDRLTRAYRVWEYCVQYAETDYLFIARLLENEGISYTFEHSAGSHALVLIDDIGSHQPLPGHASIPYYPADRATIANEEHIQHWTYATRLRSGEFENDDYDFHKPAADLTTRQLDPPGHSHDHWPIYEWPGCYSETGDGEHYARVRMQALQSDHEVMHGQSNVKGMAPGYLFTLQRYPRGDQNRQYLILQVDYDLLENAHTTAPGEAGANGEPGAVQRLDFTAHPASRPWRPQRRTPWPLTNGPQTAVVVGPPGEEIWTNEHGQIKVQFHWDRYGQHNQHSNCWVRVTQPWAGANFGGVSIPRIGQEVIIDFENGDPDRPLAVGCVYNARQMPPWGLPGNATQSGILTRSSKGGGYDNANALRFEDKRGAEQLWLHAEKDQLTEVEHDEDKWVGNDRRKTIDRDETTVVHRHRTETVDGNETITVHQNRSETVDQNETITIHQNRTERVDLNETISIGQNRSEDVGQSETVSIGANRTKTVRNTEKTNIGKTKTDRIGKSWSVTVGFMKNEMVGLIDNQLVGLLKTVTVGMSHILNVGVSYVQNIGQSMSTTVGKTCRIEAGESFEIVCGQSLIKLGKDGKIAITGTSINISAVGGPVEINGQDIFLNPPGGQAASMPDPGASPAAAGGAPAGCFGGAGLPGAGAMDAGALAGLAKKAGGLLGLASTVTGAVTGGKTGAAPGGLPGGIVASGIVAPGAAPAAGQIQRF